MPFLVCVSGCKDAHKELTKSISIPSLMRLMRLSLLLDTELRSTKDKINSDAVASTAEEEAEETNAHDIDRNAQCLRRLLTSLGSLIYYKEFAFEPAEVQLLLQNILDHSPSFPLEVTDQCSWVIHTLGHFTDFSLGYLDLIPYLVKLINMDDDPYSRADALGTLSRFLEQGKQPAVDAFNQHRALDCITMLIESQTDMATLMPALNVLFVLAGLYHECLAVEGIVSQLMALLEVLDGGELVRYVTRILRLLAFEHEPIYLEHRVHVKMLEIYKTNPDSEALIAAAWALSAPAIVFSEAGLLALFTTPDYLDWLIDHVMVQIMVFGEQRFKVVQRILDFGSKLATLQLGCSDSDWPLGPVNPLFDRLHFYIDKFVQRRDDVRRYQEEKMAALLLEFPATGRTTISSSY